MAEIMSCYMPSFPNATEALLVAGSIYAVIEVALHVKEYLWTGQSVFMKLKGASAYVVNEDLEFPLFTSNNVTGGDRQKIASNRLGFRSPEILLQRDPDESPISPSPKCQQVDLLDVSGRTRQVSHTILRA